MLRGVQVIPAVAMAGTGWHGLTDERLGYTHPRLTTPIAVLWACRPAFSLP